MTVEELKSTIQAHLDCQHITLNGDGRHWFATIVSSSFEGKRSITRHQMVYATLGDRIQKDEVHALSMRTFTPKEWEQIQSHS
jgi:acid stress-induced BolA-like protein IbaG/YrbA